MHLECTTIWSAPAAPTSGRGSLLKETPACISRFGIECCDRSFLEERSGDGAFVDSVPPADSKAASRFACRRTPYILRMEALGGTAKFRTRWLASFMPRQGCVRQKTQ